MKTVDFNVGCVVCGGDTGGRRFHDAPLCQLHHDVVCGGASQWLRDSGGRESLAFDGTYYEGEQAWFADLLARMIAYTNDPRNRIDAEPSQ